MTLYFTSPVEQNVVDANAQIELNCGIPCPGTERWAVVIKAYEQDLWFIPMPDSDGWNQYTQAQMIEGVINVEIEPKNSDWWPPVPPPAQ